MGIQLYEINNDRNSNNVTWLKQFWVLLLVCAHTV